jgi:hypothetical protein
MRVSADALKKLNAFIDALPSEARGKCALCNETLTHLVKLAEVETGAGTATVTRVLAEKINEDAAPGDRVSGDKLRDRVRIQSGEKLSGIKSQITESATTYNQEEQDAIADGEFFDGQRFATMAIEQLRRIKKDDPDRVAALNRVKEWIDKNLNS